MSTIDNQLKEIKHGKKISAATAEEKALQLDGFKQSTSGLGSGSSPGSYMDSIILDNHQLIQDQTDDEFQEQESTQDANEMWVDVLEESADPEMNAVVEEIPEGELEMDDGFEFDLKLDEDELETNSVENESAADPVDVESVTDGLEQLKHSGLEDQFAESRFTESSAVDRVEEPEQKLRAGLTPIDLAVNDFEDPVEIWSRSPDLEQTLREGLTDISLEYTDFQPEYPKNLSSFETPAETMSQDMEISEDSAENESELDNYKLQQSTDENEIEEESPFDNMLLFDSADEEFEEDLEVEDVEQYVFETSADEFEEELDLDLDDTEIGPMVHDSLNGQEDNEESALGELEELSEQMEALESDETEFEAEEEEFEDALEKEVIEKVAIASEGIVAEGITEAEVDSEEFLADIMAEELGELLAEDDVLEADDGAEDGIVGELEGSVIDRLDDLVDDDVEFDSETYYETSPEVQEEVFDSWDEAEDAFMDFDRETVFDEKDSTHLEIDGSVFDNLDEDFPSSESYRFTEKELKEIVTGSVHKALEKSIASSLVELAVSELKTQVTQMDQSSA